jgi:hypothetical protein
VRSVRLCCASIRSMSNRSRRVMEPVKARQQQPEATTIYLYSGLFLPKPITNNTSSTTSRVESDCIFTATAPFKRQYMSICPLSIRSLQVQEYPLMPRTSGKSSVYRT